jgi:hypothetical protein
MDGTPAYDARHDTLSGKNVDTLADQNLGIPTTHSDDPQESIVVDVMYHQPDLVSMTGQHYGGRGARVDFREGVAVYVGPGPIGESFSRCPPDGCRHPFMSGGTWRIKQSDQKIARLGIHRYSIYWCVIR